jgi:hypothetical protein
MVKARRAAGVSALTGTTSALLLVFLAVAACLILAIFVGIPYLVRLTFRARLEVIRDDCMDAILDGRLAREKSVCEFLQVMDNSAEIARRSTLSRALATFLALRQLGVRDPRELVSSPDYCDLEPSQQEVMESFEERNFAAVRSVILWGSPLGWLLAPVAWLASRYHPQGELAKTDNALPLVAREVVCERSELASMLQRRSRHSFAGR